jgi:ABC-type multidrug transport system fused ATPase/permease subunit
MHETFQKWNNEYFNSVIEANKVAASWNPFTPLILNLFSVIFITLGADLVMKSHFSIGELVAAITYLATMGGPIRAISGFSGMYSSAKAAAERIFEIMDRIPSIKDAPDAIALDHVQGNLEFRDVHFSYNAKSEILKDISLIVQPGERIALVGPSGVGKTTFVHMIPRFYDATQGSVLIDGIDVRKIQLNSLRRNVGIVMQNVYLYDGTIAQNIAYGKPEANLEEIQAAAQIAQLDEFIQTLPEQYNTPIGERGVKLSGGQAQRLSIARVLVTDPKLLILDEPTANVDAITDQNLMGAIQSIMKNRTTVIIAHRLWTIKNADKIVLLRDGKIEAIGNHQELMHNCPFYREFFDSQFSKEDLI